MSNLVSFKYFESKAAFDRELQAGNIIETSICFIPEVNLIYARGNYWYCPYSKEEIDQMIVDSSEETIQNITAQLTQLQTNLEGQINTKADSADLENYLPLSGGTLKNGAHIGLDTINDSNGRSSQIQFDDQIIYTSYDPRSKNQYQYITIGEDLSVSTDGNQKGIIITNKPSNGTLNVGISLDGLGIIDTEAQKLTQLTLDGIQTTGGIQIQDKTTSDLLNAGGSTTPISNIVTQVQAAIVDSAPETLDTLKELATALGNDPNFATTISTQLGNKLDTNTYNTEKAQFATKTEITELDNSAIKRIQVGTNAVQNPTAGLVTIVNATEEADGSMSKEDKTKIDKLIDNGDGNSFLANDGTYKAISTTLSDDYAASIEVNEALAPEAGDTYQVAISKLHKAILDNEEVTSAALVNIQTVLGVENPNQSMPDLSDTNYLNGQTQFVAALKALDTAIKTIADQTVTISDLTSRVSALEDALTLQIIE